MSDSVQSAPELVFQSGQSGVKQRRVEHDLVQEHCLDLIETSFQCHDVVAKVLDHLE